MDDVARKMMEHLKEELEDVEEYHEMSQEAARQGLHRRAKNLEKIAMEEYTHARYIRETLIEVGAYIPAEHAECEEMWGRVRRDLFHKYR